MGQTKDPGCLEDQARQAVEIADIVLLCFDTQSQQETEFKKVAEWIQAYGKPTIAVLNCRNQRCECQHALNSEVRGVLFLRQFVSIRETSAMNSRIGSTLRSRDRNKCQTCTDCAMPMNHSKVQMRSHFQKQRLEYGLDRLFKWSNLLALENLISTALERDAPGNSARDACSQFARCSK